MSISDPPPPDYEDLRELARGLRLLRGTHFAEVLAEMNSEHHTLTRALLGAGADDREPADPQRGRKARS